MNEREQVIRLSGYVIANSRSAGPQAEPGNRKKLAKLLHLPREAAGVGTFRKVTSQADQTVSPAAQGGRGRWNCWLFSLAILLAGCSKTEDHGHPPGVHGGIIVPVGVDHYHAEALFTDAGELKLFMLGKDEAQVVQISRQEITAYLAAPGNAKSKPMVLKPDPQPGDSDKMTSAFVGKLPEGIGATVVMVVVPSIEIEGKRYRFSFASNEPLMPAKISNEAERELYLKPGGIYTQEDIQANGSTTPSEKYRGFQSAHDMHPKSGDQICPITKTLANPKCSWIVAGKEYLFCCPPCIDEFVKLAKENPQAALPPDKYVQP